MTRKVVKSPVTPEVSWVDGGVYIYLDEDDDGPTLYLPVADAERLAAELAQCIVWARGDE